MKRERGERLSRFLGRGQKIVAWPIVVAFVALWPAMTLGSVNWLLGTQLPVGIKPTVAFYELVTSLLFLDYVVGYARRGSK